MLPTFRTATLETVGLIFKFPALLFDTEGVANPNKGPWIPVDRIEELISPEPALVIVGLALISWLIYKILLRRVSDERHRTLRRLFRNLGGHLVLGTLTFSIYWAVSTSEVSPLVERLNGYLGAFVLLVGLILFVKVARIFVFEYFFLSHMRVAVPALLINLVTLLLSLILSGWLVAELFNINVGPLVATSAGLSLVLGLALQETLGNLLAGVALQFDKPFEIGDWIEVQTGGNSTPYAGQVQEITWRATILLGFTDENITLPNRMISQAEIANFTTRRGPIARMQNFRIPHHCSPEHVRRLLVQSIREVPGVLNHPAPLVILKEVHESWILFRLVYFIEDYGGQFLIGDQVLTRALATLEKSRIPLATPQMTVHRAHEV